MHKQLTILFLNAYISAQTLDEQINALIDQKIAAALAKLELPDHRHPQSLTTTPLAGNAAFGSITIANALDLDVAGLL